MRLSNLCVGMIAAFAAGAVQATINLDLMWSTDRGATWSTGIVSALPGSTVQMAIVASGDVGYGFAAATLRLSGTGRNAGDTLAFAPGTLTGRVPPFTFGAATNAIYYDSPTAFRIDAASDPDNTRPEAGMTFFQRDPATSSPGAFATANPVMVFAFEYTLGPFGRDLGTVLQLDQLTNGSAAYYASSSSRTTTRDFNVRLGSLVIMIPAPGAASLAFLGLAGGLMRRRRS